MAGGEMKADLVGHFETGEVFQSFLRLVSTGKIEHNNELDGVLELLFFLQKWDCPAAISTLLLHVEVAVSRREVCALDAFFIAAAVTDENLARAALLQDGWSWHDDAETPFNEEGIRGRSCWDPRGWPLKQWEKWDGVRNYRYLFALSRAFDDLDDFSDDQGDMADRFVYYLAKVNE
jgi:hypothetical protein